MKLKKNKTIKQGNCYPAAEALYHILGGKKAGWKPMVVKLDKKTTHWFLQHKTGVIVDPSRLQFKGKKMKPDYKKAKGCGFLTKKPSNRAIPIIDQLTWHYIRPKLYWSFVG